MAQEGKLSQVEGFLEKMANPKGPFRVEILKTLTPLYFGMFDMTKANMISKLWTEAEPGSAEAFQWRGLILDRIGSKEDTDSAFSKSLELDPNRVDVLIYLASRKLRSHETQPAMTLIERAERLSPGHIDLPLLRARALSEMGKEEEARAFLASHVSKDPHPAIFRELGRLELKAGKIADALEHLKRAVDAFPMDQSIRFSLAQAQEQLGKKEDAAASRARLKAIEADLDKMKVITQQVVTKPNDPAPRAEAAKIMAQNGVGIEACRWAMSALRLDPENVEARKVLQENQASLAEVNQYRSVLEYLR
jgi:Flp pilus assembly protein TadD